jgi:hypothetical protein
MYIRLIFETAFRSVRTVAMSHTSQHIAGSFDHSFRIGFISALIFSLEIHKPKRKIRPLQTHSKYGALYLVIKDNSKQKGNVL